MMKNKVLVAIRVFVALAVWFLIGRGYSVFVDPMLDGRLPELVRKILSGMVVPYTVGLGVSFLILLGMKKEIPAGQNLIPTMRIFTGVRL